MRELRTSIVFEVDHPDTQRIKIQKVAPLTREAREVRFVPVDFGHDNLAGALKAAGHDASLPTAWLWEGVVMYLDRDQIEATLRVVEDRSAPGSRLVVAYHQPALMLLLLSVIVRGMGEPIRTVLTPGQMHELLARYGFSVRWDRELPAIGSQLSPEIGRATRLMHHLRIVSANRESTS